MGWGRGWGIILNQVRSSKVPLHLWSSGYAEFTGGSVYNEEYAEWVAGEGALARNMEDREYWRNELQGWVDPECLWWRMCRMGWGRGSFLNKLLSCWHKSHATISYYPTAHHASQVIHPYSLFSTMLPHTSMMMPTLAYQHVSVPDWSIAWKQCMQCITTKLCRARITSS